MGVFRLLLTLLLSLASVPLRAATENELKAAYVLKFASFASWPASTTSEFTIGIAGDSAIADDFVRSVAGAKVRGKPVTVRKVSSASDASGCQILYIPAGGNAGLVSAVPNHPVLTVGETDRFTDSGGIIELKKVGTKLRFAINKSAASQARIEISAQLLKLSATDK